MSRYLERALSGETATSQEWNDHLIAFHREYSGVTEDLLLQMETPGGETSYDVLASRIKALAPGAKAVLDIGCGNGVLLARIAERFGREIALTGIDLSEPDIARARKRLPGATFLCGDALALGMSQKSEDVVTSHLAFMAMPALGAVLERARNALRDSGLLAFVAEDPLAGGTIFELLGSAVAAVRDRFPAFTPSIPGREPIERADVLQPLLARAGFSRVSIEPFAVRARLSGEQIWHFVERSYPFGLLDATARDDLRETLGARIGAIEHGPEGAMLALRFVSAHA